MSNDKPTATYHPEPVITGPIIPAKKEPWWKWAAKFAGKVAFGTVVGATTLGLIAAVSLAGTIGALLGAAGSSGDDTPLDTPTVAEPADTTEPSVEATTPAAGVPVVLETSSTVPAEISWSDLDVGGTEPEPVTGPWSKELTSDPEGVNYYSVSVYGGAEPGEVSCKITVDGTVVDENTAAGEYASATCSTS